MSKDVSKNNEVVIIIGATGDIGGRVAEYLHQKNHTVVCVGRNIEKLNSLKEKGMHIFRGDTDNQFVVSTLLEYVTEKIGIPKCLITSTGNRKPIGVNSDPNVFSEQLSLDLISVATATILPIFTFNQYFRSGNEGVIFDISSHVTSRLLSSNLTYAPAKAVVANFIKQLREENTADVKGNNVQICQIIPSLIDTPKNRKDNPDLSEEDWGKAIKTIDIAEWIDLNMNSNNIPNDKEFSGSLIV